MTISEKKRSQIIEALNANPNAEAVASQVGGVSRQTVCGIAKKAGIGLGKGRPQVPSEKRSQIINALKANPNHTRSPDRLVA